MRSTYYLLTFFIWLLTFINGHATDVIEYPIDSLETYYTENGRNSNKLAIISKKLFNQKAKYTDPIELANIKMYHSFSYYPSDSSRLFTELSEAIILFEQSNPDLIYKPLYHLSYYFNKFGLQIKRKNNLLKAISNMKKYSQQEDVFYWFNCHIALAACNNDLGEFEEALEAAIFSKNIATKANNIRYAMRAAINLSSTYGNLSIKSLEYGSRNDRKEFEQKALIYFLESHDLAQKIGKPRDICLTSFNLGLYYSEHKKYSESNRFLNECIELAKSHHLNYDFFTAHEIKGENLLEIGKLQEGYTTLLVAAEKARESNSIEVRTKGMFLEAKLDWLNHKYSAAIFKVEKAILLSSDNLRLQQRGHDLLYGWYKTKGNYKFALEHREQWSTIKNNIANEKTILELKKQSANFQKAENERKIAVLQKEQLEDHLVYNKKLIWIGSSIILLVIGTILYFFKLNNSRIKEAQKFTELEQRMLRSQMNPHFTFNALSSIQNFLLQDGKSRQGALYLAKFAKLMRHILNQTLVSSISISEEVKTLENYLTIQQMRFDKAFTYEIEIANNINKDLNEIPPMMIQPLVENAIEHGKIYTFEGGNVSIKFTKSHTHIIVEILDNGVGFKDISPISKSPKKTQALNIISDRLDLLNKNNRESRLELIHPDTGGSKVILYFPHSI